MADTPKNPVASPTATGTTAGTTAGTTGTDTKTEDKPQWFRVVLTHPSLNKRTVFRSLSESRARTWLENHYPRGSEAHLVKPDGSTEAFEADRTGERGADAEKWGDFDPDSWTPAEQTPPPGQDEWADKEG
jgi:hypothetical protein